MDFGLTSITNLYQIICHRDMLAPEGQPGPNGLGDFIAWERGQICFYLRKTASAPYHTTISNPHFSCSDNGFPLEGKTIELERAAR